MFNVVKIVLFYYNCVVFLKEHYVCDLISIGFIFIIGIKFFVFFFIIINKYFYNKFPLLVAKLQQYHGGGEKMWVK